MPEFNDEIWKRSIHTLFRPMVGFHFPELHPLIDWSREPAFLEEELANLFDPKKTERRRDEEALQNRPSAPWNSKRLHSQGT